MTTRFATESEISQWNDLIVANPDGGNVFQSLEYSNLKQLGHWRPRFIVCESIAISVLEKTVFGLGTVWYIMKGPGISTPDDLMKLLPGLRSFAKSQRVFSVKIEPEILKNKLSLAALAATELVPTGAIQPNVSTIVLDIAPSLDEILTTMPQTGRYAIKRAERDGVMVRQVPATDENCDLMFTLLRDTALASHFGIRAPVYYKTYWQDFEKSGLGQLFFAYVDGQIVAGAYAFVYGHKSTYKDGASIRKRTAYGASHLLQWHVIQWAKQRGSIVHDLCGAPPADRIKDPTHPHYGIGLFKTQFNKQVTEYVGAYDLPIVGWKYALWHKYIEKLIRKLHYKMKHESYY